MSKLISKRKIDNYEESWQKQCYFESGDGKNYIYCCEICLMTSGDILRIPGGHYICTICKKRLKLLTKETIIKKGKAKEKWDKQMGYKFPHLIGHPSESIKVEREKTWKKLIKEDYLIAMFNQEFNYLHSSK